VFEREDVVTELRFNDYVAICDTKARYCRFLDEKNWAGYADTFTEDAVLDTRPSGGPQMRGRDSLVKAVRASIETATTVHQVHLPEISMLDANTADVVWAMQDRVIWDDTTARKSGRRSLTGYGHYRERFIRCGDGQWRIFRSTLTRLHIDIEPYSEPVSR
jgi:ketosteroid isomerase-like protein